jgi:hypothetical protein
MLPQPPFDSPGKEQQLAEAFRNTLEQCPPLQTLWLIVAQGLDTHIQIPYREKDSWFGLWASTFPPHDPLKRFETFLQYLARLDPAWEPVIRTATGKLWLMETAEGCAKGRNEELMTAIRAARSTPYLPSVRDLAMRFAEALQRKGTLRTLWMLVIRGMNPRYTLSEQAVADPFFWIGETAPSHGLDARLVLLERWLPTLAPEVIRDIPDGWWQVWLKEAAMRCAKGRYRNPWRPWIEKGRAKGSGQFRDAEEFRTCMRTLILEFYKVKHRKPTQRDLALMSATSPHSPAMSARAIRCYCYDTFDETIDLDRLIQEVLQQDQR